MNQSLLFFFQGKSTVNGATIIDSNPDPTNKMIISSSKALIVPAQ